MGLILMHRGKITAYRTRDLDMVRRSEFRFHARIAHLQAGHPGIIT